MELASFGLSECIAYNNRALTLFFLVTVIICGGGKGNESRGKTRQACLLTESLRPPGQVPWWVQDKNWLEQRLVQCYYSSQISHELTLPSRRVPLDLWSEPPVLFPGLAVAYGLQVTVLRGRLPLLFVFVIFILVPRELGRLGPQLLPVCTQALGALELPACQWGSSRELPGGNTCCTR